MNELIVIQDINAVEVFTKDGLDPILDKIEKEVKSFVIDISTASGRKEMASLAYNIARSKTALDDLGKTLVADKKKEIAKVDGERRRLRERLDTLKEDVRKPLTEWEDNEKARVADHKSSIKEIENAGLSTTQSWQSLPLQAMHDRLEEIKNDSRDWQEFEARAELTKKAVIEAIETAIEKRELHEAEQAELARLRKEGEERKRKEHEEKIAREAAEKAKREAEEKAAREKAEAEARAKAEQEAAERKQRELEERAKAAERAKIEAEKQAKLEAERAAKHERERIEAEQRAEQEAIAKREADKKHRESINSEAINAIMHCGCNATEETARLIIDAIAAGKIPHVKVMY